MKKNKTRNKWVKNIVIAALLLIFATAAAALGALGLEGYVLYQEAAQDRSVEQMAEAIRQSPDFTPLDELPPLYVDAVLAAEDKRFYTHPGFDAIAIGRATLHNIEALSYVEGGSTITQQLAKNQYFTQEKRMERKIAEVFMAMQIESTLSKDEILELYVNSIYFGDNLHGIGEASRGYFGKAPAALSDVESVLLAGIPNAPSAYAWDEHPDLASQRAAQVLRLMVEQEALNKQEAEVIRDGLVLISA